MLRNLIRHFKDRAIARLPSRIFLEQTVVPALAADGRRRMLAVGTLSYVQGFYRRGWTMRTRRYARSRR